MFDDALGPVVVRADPKQPVLTKQTLSIVYFIIITSPTMIDRELFVCDEYFHPHIGHTAIRVRVVI